MPARAGDPVALQLSPQPRERPRGGETTAAGGIPVGGVYLPRNVLRYYVH